jgi:DNA-binding NarL/FixJ family response regulator
MKKLDIFVVDDHALFRKGLAAALASADIAEHIHEAANGADFLKVLDTCQPDIVMMDISMPVMDGVEATRQALASCPGLKVLALSMHHDKEHFQDMIDAGVMGFVAKDEKLEEIIRAINTVITGEKYFSETLMSHFFPQSFNDQTCPD